MQKASKLIDFMNVFNHNPLDDESFYEDLNEVHNLEVKKLKHFCLGSTNPYAKILFSGHNGSGKTTEINHLVALSEIQQKFEVIRINLAEDVGTQDLNFIDFIFEIMATIVLHLGKNHSQDLEKDSTEFLNPLHDYCCSAGGLLEPIHEVAVTASEKLKDLAKQAVKGQHIFKTGTYTKEELRDKLEPFLAELIECINVAIQGIHHMIAPKQLLLIIDDLDKIDSQCVKQIFVQCLEVIFSLCARVIFVLPIALTVSPDFSRVRNRADTSFTLGVLNPLDKNVNIAKQSIQTLKQLVLKRAEECLFEKGALDALIKKSGGILKDLFCLLINASLNAVIEHPETTTISVHDVWKSCLNLQREYVRLIESAAHYDYLKVVYETPWKTFDYELLMNLLQNSLVIEYSNGEDRLLHPLVVDYMKSNDDIV